MERRGGTKPSRKHFNRFCNLISKICAVSLLFIFREGESQSGFALADTLNETERILTMDNVTFIAFDWGKVNM